MMTKQKTNSKFTKAASLAASLALVLNGGVKFASALRRTIDRVRTQNCLNFVSNRGAHQRCRWLVRLFVHLTLSLSLLLRKY